MGGFAGPLVPPLFLPLGSGCFLPIEHLLSRIYLSSTSRGPALTTLRCDPPVPSTATTQQTIVFLFHVSLVPPDVLLFEYGT
jgi:hypothetical protein